MHGYMIITGHAGFELDYICGTKSSNGKDGEGTHMPYVQPQTLKKDMFINNLDPIHNRHGEEKTDKDRSRGRRGEGKEDNDEDEARCMSGRKKNRQSPSEQRSHATFSCSSSSYSSPMTRQKEARTATLST